MDQTGDTTIRVSGFMGLVSNLNPRALKPGQAAEQENVAVVRMGEFAVRRGLKELVFDSDEF